MSQRVGKNYKVDQESWERRDRLDYGDVPEGCEYWVGDLIDHHGYRWRDGAHKIKVPKRPNCRVRSTTYYGESAWSDAARALNDYAIWLRYESIHGRST
jgi:hypothetical protein